MARANKSNPNGDAFSYSTTSKINNCIANMMIRVKRTLTVPDITYRDMLELIAKPEHIELLLTARRIADINRYNAKSTDRLYCAKHKGKDLFVEFGVDGDEESPLMPRANYWLADNSTSELAKELIKCGREYADLAIEWGHVKTVFKYLNEQCKTPAQVRYIWPSLLGIMALDDDLDGLRSDISAFVVPRNLPTLPPEVRALCRSTAATVAMATLLPPLENVIPKEPKVQISFQVDDNATELGVGVFTYGLNA